VVAQHARGLQVVVGGDGDRHFAQAQVDALGQRAQHLVQGGLQRGGIDRERVLAVMRQARAMVCVRRIFCCSWMIPYSSASAVGGQPGT
jgi:hypothetical protein